MCGKPGADDCGTHPVASAAWRIAELEALVDDIACHPDVGDALTAVERETEWQRRARSLMKGRECGATHTHGGVTTVCTLPPDHDDDHEQQCSGGEIVATWARRLAFVARRGTSPEEGVAPSAACVDVDGQPLKEGDFVEVVDRGAAQRIGLRAKIINSFKGPPGWIDLRWNEHPSGGASAWLTPARFVRRVAQPKRGDRVVILSGELAGMFADVRTIDSDLGCATVRRVPRTDVTSMRGDLDEQDRMYQFHELRVVPEGETIDALIDASSLGSRACPTCGERDCGAAPRFVGTTLEERMAMRGREAIAAVMPVSVALENTATFLSDLLSAVGWQIGSFADVIAEVRRLRERVSTEVEEARREAAAVRRAYLHERHRAQAAIIALHVFAPTQADHLESQAYSGPDDYGESVHAPEPYWRKLPPDLRAEVLETHYLTAKESLEQTASERDHWKKGCQEWQEAGFKSRARVAELEAAQRTETPLRAGPSWQPKVDVRVVHELALAHGAYGFGLVIGVPWPEWVRVRWEKAGVETFEHVTNVVQLAPVPEKSDAVKP